MFTVDFLFKGVWKRVRETVEPEAGACFDAVANFRGCSGEEPGTKSSVMGAKVVVLADDIIRLGSRGEDVGTVSLWAGG